MGYGEVTDEGIAELRARIGQVNRRGLFGGYNSEACRDNLRHFVDGIGDLNPLYRDPEVARAVGYPALPAHPGFLFSIHPGWVLQGLRGVHGMQGGHEWEFYLSALLGDDIEPESRLKDVQEKQSKWAGRVVWQYDETTYRNQGGSLLGKVVSWNIRGSRDQARERGTYNNREEHRYTEEELAAIDRAYQNERYQGSTPRYWEDVEVGHELDSIVRGPFSMSDLIAYYSGAMGAKAHGIAMAQFRKHPAWAMRDARTGAPVEVVRAHDDSSLSKEVGVGRPYDVGGQRCSWGLSMLTNWMGNDAFLTHSYSENRYPVFVGDTIWLGGKVTEKSIVDGEHVAQVEHWGRNQRGENVLPGKATIALPSRAESETPVQRRLKHLAVV